MEATLKMAAGEEVKLVGAWSSPFVIRARVALNLKGVGYEFFQETFGNKSELLLKSNPVYKKVPVLIHNGNPICESLIIVHYVDDVWSSSSPAILPTDPYDRAIAQFWAFYLDDKLWPAILGAFLGETPEAKVEAAGQISTSLQLLEEAFEKCSKGKDFFGGDTVGYLDIALGSFVGWLGVVGELSGTNFLEEGGKTPLLVAWAKRFCAVHGVEELMPEVGKLVEFAVELKAFLSGLKSGK